MTKETNTEDGPATPVLDGASTTSSGPGDQAASDREVDAGDDPGRRGGPGVVRWLVLCVVVLVVVFGAVGGGAWYWYEHIYRVELSGVVADVDRLKGSQTEIGARISASKADADAGKVARGDLTAAIEGVRRAQAGLEKSVGALYERETQSPVDWILAEAEYLVFAASQRLALEGDVKTAAAALRGADERLQTANDPDLTPIREGLVQDIAALEAVNLPDTEGLAIYFAEVISRVDDLPTKPIANLGPPFSSTKNEKYTVENWRNVLNAVWSDLVNLVQVKDAELPDSVLFDPELRYFLRQNLRLELASARLAVLRRDTASLRVSTSLLKRFLTTYYDIDDAAVSAIVQRLDGASKVELAPELPRITGSLDKIRQYRRARAHDSPRPFARGEP